MDNQSSTGTILVIGALGQIGSDLVHALRLRYGSDKVIAADIRPAPAHGSGPYLMLDALDREAQMEAVRQHKVHTIYNLAAILSAKGEQDPQMAWKINMESLMNSLETVRHTEAQRLFWPSSIAVFGPTSPKENTPQRTVMEPNTVYGISKQAGERWCEYYFEKYGVDVRSIRYPGLISYRGKPGGGTTDYAVDIFHHALRGEAYRCFLQVGTRLPMMYMPDAIKATISLMEAPGTLIKNRSSYNLSGMSFAPEEIYAEIKRLLPDFEMTYLPDFRQKIADSWPGSIDDSAAREDWGWQESYSLPEMVVDMLDQLKQNGAYLAPALEEKRSR
ncbi:MAG: NAD-dependent epimerase/dehydratase family protein [Bacteroidia bacterium]|nr:NAD-dependent epimerase/dehydratase family protein [Bacteroidia bacterium]